MRHSTNTFGGQHAREKSIAALAVLGILFAGGWLAGAHAASTGYVTWIHFKTADVPLCGQHRAAVNVHSSSVQSSATERATNRSGTTCGTNKARGADKIRVHLYLFAEGSLAFHDWNGNTQGSYYANQRKDYTGITAACWEAAAAGREYDSDIGGFRAPNYAISTGEVCFV